MKKYLIYKNQITGFKDVQRTVKVVEKAAASHIHFLKKRVENLSEYENEIKRVLARIQAFGLNEKNFLLREKKAGSNLLLIIGGNKGIVGGLYHDLTAAFLENANRYEEIWVLGEKITEYLGEEGIKTKQITYDIAGLPESEEIRKLSAALFVSFQNPALRRIDVLYPQFISPAEQNPVFVKFLPFNLFSEEILEKSGNGEGLPIFETSQKEVFTGLLRKYANVFFTQIVLEAKLSEFAARTVAAEHAAAKTREIIKALNLDFLKERRREITQKQLESFVGHKTL